MAPELPPLPPELVCSLCRGLVLQAVMLPCCAGTLCSHCAGEMVRSRGGECGLCGERGGGEEDLIPYRLLRQKVRSSQ